MFVIDDEWHAEPIGEYASRTEAMAELRRMAALPWDEHPNKCPCRSWRSCGRRYRLIEYDCDWRRLNNQAILDVSAKGTVWLGEMRLG
ncbi:hypothetical protein [Sphingomonas sanguinis]|jgi:hypothetical protein|uniref:Uncharacterized protein n=1 Tax=Sphingomonas sanguinis TaxID=33051 RepID=A0A7Y7QTX6_9SPHN|nr:hypothetical protein [Sphingomonas sanguinis]MBZ6381079.1 hypothetical protein [Sphingomonas sanguinis]NNG51317.1 hypothetical protein [Sphingomonas sanguinis]NNG55267.1 hypothetical protein [Sphingomonas sanguinis]NVP30381.1 hypothetical protein [Sphingomonas sanguinis]